MSAKTSAGRTPARAIPARASRSRKNLWLTTMVLPGAVWLLLIRYLPMYGILIAFKRYRAYKPNTFWNNIAKSEWVGLKNFEFLKFCAELPRPVYQCFFFCIIYAHCLYLCCILVL